MMTVKEHEAFRKDLIHLLGYYGCGKDTNTPCDILADMMLAFYDAYELHVNRRDQRMRKPYHAEPKEDPCSACVACDPDPDADEDEEEDECNERGYIVIRHLRGKKHLAFVEWRNRKPVLSNSAAYAINFKYRGMAENVAEKLGEMVGGKWGVVDLDELEENNEANERLLKAIFGEDDDESNG